MSRHGVQLGRELSLARRASPGPECKRLLARVAGFLILSQANCRPGASVRFATIAPLQKNFPRLSPSCNGSRTNGRSMPTARGHAPAEPDRSGGVGNPVSLCVFDALLAGRLVKGGLPEDSASTTNDRRPKAASSYECLLIRYADGGLAACPRSSRANARSIGRAPPL
jgi:hypothetical protein